MSYIRFCLSHSSKATHRQGLCHHPNTNIPYQWEGQWAFLLYTSAGSYHESGSGWVEVKLLSKKKPPFLFQLSNLLLLLSSCNNHIRTRKLRIQRIQYKLLSSKARSQVSSLKSFMFPMILHSKAWASVKAWSQNILQSGYILGPSLLISFLQCALSATSQEWMLFSRSEDLLPSDHFLQVVFPLIECQYSQRVSFHPEFPIFQFWSGHQLPHSCIYLRVMESTEKANSMSAF